MGFFTNAGAYMAAGVFDEFFGVVAGECGESACDDESFSGQCLRIGGVCFNLCIEAVLDEVFDNFFIMRFFKE